MNKITQQIKKDIEKKEMNVTDIFDKYGITLNDTDEQGNTLLHLSILFSNPKMMTQILLRNTDGMDKKNKEGYTPLHLAVRIGNKFMVGELLDKGAHLDTESENGNTALHIAISHNLNDIVEMLINAGAKLNVVNKEGLAPLHFAVLKNNTSIVTLLLESKRVLLSIKSSSGNTPLHLAVRKKNVEIFHMLLHNEGPDPTLLEKDLTPELLNVASVNLSLVNDDGDTVLSLVIKKSDYSMLSYLLDMGVDIDTPINGEPPLQLALRLNNTLIIKKLKKHLGIPETQKELSPEMVLQTFEYAKNRESQRNLMNELHRAVRNKNYDEVTRILDANEINIESQTSMTNETPLHLAVSMNDLPMVELLLKREANINSQNVGGSTPLYTAMNGHNTEMVKFLLTQGASVNVTNRLGDTPLHFATFVNDIEVVKLLFKKGANINSQNAEGNTPLYNAIRNDNMEIFDFLLTQGASVNVENSYGDTPLHFTARCMNTNGNDMALKLISLGGTSGEKTHKHICVQCNILPAPNSCARCHMVYYCSKECQKKHWTLHKLQCVKWVDAHKLYNERPKEQKQEQEQEQEKTQILLNLSKIKNFVDTAMASKIRVIKYIKHMEESKASSELTGELEKQKKKLDILKQFISSATEVIKSLAQVISSIDTMTPKDVSKVFTFAAQQVDTIRRALPVTDDKDIPIDIRMEAVMDTYRTINSNGKQLLVEYTSIIENEKDVFPEIVGILQEKRDTLKKILEKLSKFEDLYTKKEYTEEELSRFEDTNKENIDEFRKIIKWNDLLSYISMYRNLKNNLSEIEVLLESTRELDREKLQGYREQIMDHIANILVNLGEFIKNSNLTIISRHLTVLQLLDDNIFDFLDEIKKRGGSKKERVYKKISKQNKSQKNNNKYTRRSSIIFKRGKLKTKNKK